MIRWYPITDITLSKCSCVENQSASEWRHGFCSSSGFPFRFLLYTGKNEERPPDTSLGEFVVTKLCESLSKNDNHCIYMDNFFSSTALFRKLAEKSLRCTGTVRQNRTEGCPSVLQTTDRGHFEFYSDDKVLVCHWQDSKLVAAATNFEEVYPTKSIERWSNKKKVQIPQPQLFSSYNKHMGGVDRLDRFMATYRPRLRNKKWWWCIFSNSINLAVTSAWLLHRELGGRLDHLQFRRQIVRYIVCTFPPKVSLPGPSRRPLDSVVKTNAQHMPSRASKEGRCKYCKRNTTQMCILCDILLHTKCFESYHKNL